MAEADIEAFKQHHEEWKVAESINCKSLKELKQLYSKWLYLEQKDNDFIDVSLAALLDREIPGDPVWLYMIGPPGALKTELIRAYSTYPKAYTLDTLTTATFISGLTQKNKETGEPEPIGGILQHIDGMVPLVKDFTTLLNSSEETRSEIYGQLRSIYDGYYEKAFGTMPRKVSVRAKIGLVCGVTPVIDKYSAMHSVLGERFLKIRTDPDKWKAATRALENEGKEQLMRQELGNATRTFLESLDFSSVPELTENQRTDILNMSMYVALLRSNIWSTYDNGYLVDMEIISSEVPTRLAKQFKHLVKLLAIIRGHPDYVTDEDMATLGRVARDTAEPRKQSIMDYFNEWGPDLAFDPNDMAGAISGLYRKSVRNHLEILQALECIETLKDSKDELYQLTEEFKPYFRAAYRIPISPLSLQKKPKNSFFGEGSTPRGIRDIVDHPILQERLIELIGLLGKGVNKVPEIAKGLGISEKGTGDLLNILDREEYVYCNLDEWRLT
jgi:hypothetical protein